MTQSVKAETPGFPGDYSVSEIRTEIKRLQKNEMFQANIWQSIFKYALRANTRPQEADTPGSRDSDAVLYKDVLNKLVSIALHLTYGEATHTADIKRCQEELEKFLNSALTHPAPKDTLEEMLEKHLKDNALILKLFGYWKNDFGDYVWCAEINDIDKDNLGEGKTPAEAIQAALKMVGE